MNALEKRIDEAKTNLKKLEQEMFAQKIAELAPEQIDINLHVKDGVKEFSCYGLEQAIHFLRLVQQKANEIPREAPPTFREPHGY